MLFASCTPAGPVSPVRGATGCYVVLHVQQTDGPTLDFLFPSFFALDSLAAPGAAIPGRQVRLPRDDLSRRAGSWSWTEQLDSIMVNAVTADQGWRLGIAGAGPEWHGRLDGWTTETTVTWKLDGRRVDCPAGLVPARQ